MRKTTTLLQSIQDAASKLRGCQLKKQNLVSPAVKRIGKELGIDCEEEAPVFVVLFYRQCAGINSDLDDISTYLDCTAIEVMHFVPAINNLISKGFVAVEKRNETILTRKKFMVCDDVMYAIIEGRKVEPLQITEEDEFDQFDFCAAVTKLKEDRVRGGLQTSRFFQNVANLEKEHAEMPFVANVRATISTIENRVLFYEMCNDTVIGGGRFNDSATNIDATLRDIYDRVKARAANKSDIYNGTHALVREKLIRQNNRNEMRLTRQGIKLLYGDASDAILGSNNVADRYEFVKRTDKLVNDMPREFDYHQICELHEDIEQLEEDNTEISMIAKAKTHIPDMVSRLIFYQTCNELVDGDSYPLYRISDFCSGRECAHIKRMIKDGSHPLVKKGIIEVTGGGLFDSAQIQLTDKGKEIFLEEDFDLFSVKVNDKELLMPDKIAEKQLFFEKGLHEQLSMLRESLAEENYQKLCQRLEDNKLPKGVAILFYGKPGTGKTETAMQIARATGRAVMHVDISATKTCWFGESEKLIKGVFTKYHHLCEKSKIKPILLFNEADAVFSKRKDSNSSNVAQTENAIQNIILEEMEKLDGILIATTNLADNLDHAFERRFLFKVKYDNPTIEAKKNIWLNKLPRLSESEAEQLAAAYDFSGGQIDNIVRKSLMEEVIKGECPTLPSLMAMCAQEKISGNNRTKVGF